jgi:hypothetical protein
MVLSRWLLRRFVEVEGFKQKFLSPPPRGLLYPPSNIPVLLLNKNFETCFPNSNSTKFWEICSEVCIKSKKKKIENTFHSRTKSDYREKRVQRWGGRAKRKICFKQCGNRNLFLIKMWVFSKKIRVGCL